ncbi:MAG: hypothetical protein HFJ57_05610 [Clostridia bacterium]|nr:hypothetical protein [Clostridia bacterium]
MERKSEKAITLISLVITIIIMLILASVTINLTIGKDGILKIAKQAAKNYTNAEEKELVDLNNITNIVDKAVNDETPTIDESVLVLKVGDYIKYDSGANGVITCRVLYPTSSEYGLQIISDRNVRNLALGSSTYSEAVNAYNNAIETLNNETEAYINTDYAYDARCVGSIPTVENGMFTKKDNGATTYVTLNFTNVRYINSLDEDTNYETDIAQMRTADVNLCTTGQDYWIASHMASPYTYGNTLGYAFSVGCVNESGVVDNKAGLCGVDSVGAANGYTYEFGLRPCISLKAYTIKITGGDGKSVDTAYVIGK